MTDNNYIVAEIAERLRASGISAIERGKIMTQVKAAIAHTDDGDHAHTPLGDHMTAAQAQELSYNQKMAISAARRVGVQLSPGKPISASAFSAAARGRAEPLQIMAAENMAYSVGLLTDD